MKTALIDDQSLYSFNLYEEINRSVPNSEIFFYGPSKTEGRISYSFTNSKKVWAPYFYPFQIFKQALRDKPQVAHIQFELNTFGSLYSNLLFPLLVLLLRISGAKVIVTMHSVLTEIDKTVLPIPFRIISPQLLRVPLCLFYKLSSSFANRIIVHSSIFKKSLRQYYTIPENKLRVIPHGVVDIKPRINNAKLEYWNSLFQGKKIVLYFGVLSPRKGLEFLINSYNDVWTKNPESLLVIAGYEPDYYRTYQQSLQNLTKSFGLDGKVFFTGFVEDEDIHALFSIAEVVVLPYVYSVSASGPLSITIQYRKPLVATKTVFFTEVLTNEVDALLVSPRDSEQLSKAINRLLGDSAIKSFLSKNLSEKAQSYSWEKIAKDTLRNYVDLLRGSSNAAS